MLPSPDQNLKIGSVGRDFFFFFLRTVRELSFPIFFLKFLNGENSGGMQSKRIYKSCKCFFKPLNTNFSKFFAQIWHKKKIKKNLTLFFRILRSVGRGQHNIFFFWPNYMYLYNESISPFLELSSSASLLMFLNLYISHEHHTNTTLFHPVIYNYVEIYADYNYLKMNDLISMLTSLNLIHIPWSWSLIIFKWLCQISFVLLSPKPCCLATAYPLPWLWRDDRPVTSVSPWSLFPLSLLLSNLDCFHTTAKCVFWILIRNAHFELKFERRYFGPCVRQITSRCVIWNAHFKWRSRGVFQLRI